MTGNGDLHAKNVSVLQREGEWRVSPIYDIPSTLPYGDHTLALTVGGRPGALSRRKLLDFGVGLGLPPAAIVLAVEEVLDVTADVPERIGAGAVPFAESLCRNLKRQLARRRRDLAVRMKV